MQERIKREKMQEIEFAVASNEFGRDSISGTVQEIHVTMTSFSARGIPFDSVVIFSVN